MNAEERIYWDDEDEGFEAEFAEISVLHQKSTKKAPSVPSSLSRRIRQQAKLHPQEDLSKNWLFGPAMLLVLVMLLMFSIGLLFAMGTPSKIDIPSKMGAPLQNGQESN